MSKQLAISSALSVLMMGAFALFGPHSHRDPLGTEAQATPAGTEMPVRAEPGRLALKVR